MNFVFIGQTIESWMNMLINKYDKVDNNLEVENLIFELHTLKTNKNKKSILKHPFERKSSAPDSTALSGPWETDWVPLGLRK